MVKTYNHRSACKERDPLTPKQNNTSKDVHQVWRSSFPHMYLEFTELQFMHFSSTNLIWAIQYAQCKW